MSVLLLDTDVFSYIVKGDTRAKDYEQVLLGHSLAISFMTVAELYQWAAMRHWGARRIGELEDVIQGYTVPPVDAEVCRRWGQIRATAKAAGAPVSPQDAWVAATAVAFGLPLVTHNPSDYQGIAELDIRSVAAPEQCEVGIGVAIQA